MKNLLKQDQYNVLANPRELKVLHLILKEESKSPNFLESRVDSLFYKQAKLHSVHNAQHSLNNRGHFSWSFPSNSNTFQRLFSWFANEKNASLQVSFQDIRQEYVVLNDLEKYLREASPLLKTQELSYNQKLLIAGNIYVITEVLKSNQFLVDIINAEKYPISEIAQQVKSYTGASIEVSANSKQLKCTLSQDWCFGFKASKILPARGYKDRWGIGEYHFSLMQNEVFLRAESVPTDNLETSDDVFFYEEE
jgi:hypothetical protein